MILSLQQELRNIVQVRGELSPASSPLLHQVAAAHLRHLVSGRTPTQHQELDTFKQFLIMEMQNNGNIRNMLSSE